MYTCMDSIGLEMQMMLGLWDCAPFQTVGILMYFKLFEEATEILGGANAPLRPPLD